MPKNHISNPYIGIIEMFESENRKSSNENRKIEIGIIEAEIRIEATQLTRRIVTALLCGGSDAYYQPYHAWLIVYTTTATHTIQFGNLN